jgi:hypothetical protein
VGLVIHGLGNVTLMRGDAKAAMPYFQETLEHFETTGTTETLIECLEDIAGLGVTLERYEAAARLFAAVTHQRDLVGFTITPLRQQDVEKHIERMRQQLDAGEIAVASDEGTALTLAGAIQIARTICRFEPSTLRETGG